MLKLLTLLLVALVAAKAYDFSDFDYNQFLFNEFQLLNEEVVDNSLRQKRDAEVVPNEKKECSGRHGEWKNGFTCCSGDTFDAEHVKQMKEVKKECALKLRANNSDIENFDPFDCEKINRIKQLIICESECFARAINILDKSGKLNREAILQRANEHFVYDNGWKQAVYEGYVDKCITQIEAKESQTQQQQ